MAGGSALAARGGFDLLAIGVERDDPAGVEFDYARLFPLHRRITVVGEINRLFRRVGFHLRDIINVGINAAENGENRQ